MDVGPPGMTRGGREVAARRHGEVASKWQCEVAARWPRGGTAIVPMLFLWPGFFPQGQAETLPFSLAG